MKLKDCRYILEQVGCFNFNKPIIRKYGYVIFPCVMEGGITEFPSMIEDSITEFPCVMEGAITESEIDLSVIKNIPVYYGLNRTR